MTGCTIEARWSMETPILFKFNISQYSRIRQKGVVDQFSCRHISTIPNHHEPVDPTQNHHLPFFHRENRNRDKKPSPNHYLPIDTVISKHQKRQTEGAPALFFRFFPLHDPSPSWSWFPHKQHKSHQKRKKGSKTSTVFSTKIHSLPAHYPP